MDEVIEKFLKDIEKRFPRIMGDMSEESLLMMELAFNAGADHVASVWGDSMKNDVN